MKAIVDANRIIGKIKPMNCVNNGPVKSAERGNFDAYKEARIPYARNHDASFFPAYGGEHSVDVHAIFPNFNADPYDETNYDFTLTDEYTLLIEEAGTHVYYRLGTKIEHANKKYGTIMPPDFQKWAIICEHIIRHYNQGWANGYKLGIEYWEIWNEPDGVEHNGKPNWSGSDEQYYDFYVVAATHLKQCFPNIKVGGPALSWMGKYDWFKNFLSTLTKDGKHTPLDFFSWHSYCFNPVHVEEYANYVRKTLDEFGYSETEQHINEYNYLIRAGLKASIPGVLGERGAAFVASMMIGCQNLPIDMLMYYDCRPNTCFNGIFDFYYLEPLKSYYSLKYFSSVYGLVNQVETKSDNKDLYVISAKKDKKLSTFVVYYPFDDTETRSSELEIEFVNAISDETKFWLTDKDYTNKEIFLEAKQNKVCIVMKPNTLLLIEKQLI